VNFCGDFLSDHYRDVTTRFTADNRDALADLERLSMANVTLDQRNQTIEKHHHHIQLWEQEQQSKPTSASLVADHLEHIVNLVGADHAAIGSDFDGISLPPPDLRDCSQLPNLTRELISRGYANGDIRKILGGNFIGLFDRVSQ
jgi:membrane dipeptidase